MTDTQKNVNGNGTGYTVTIQAFNTITQKENTVALWFGRLIGLGLCGFSTFVLVTLFKQETLHTIPMLLVSAFLVFGLGLMVPEIVIPLLMGLVGLYKKAKG